MYKALNIRNNTEIIILDPKWLKAINQLRELDHQDFLVCQGCKQPIRVRAGEQRREHFAHKHLENCIYADESTVLRNARAVLYEWLMSKFGEDVTIEKKVDGTDLFRPIDCWVKQDTKIFAYWIFDSTLKLEKRKILQESLAKLGVHLNWIFASEMLRIEQEHSNHLILSTTEREFIKHSKYDLVPAKGHLTNGSLHYLDINNQKLITFRCLSSYHGPQVYSGLNLISQLDQVKVSPENGEFVHDGEFEKLQQYRKRLVSSITYNPNKLKNVVFENLESASNIESPKSEHQNSGIQSNYDSLQSKSGICIFCGEVTYDWWWRDGKTGECRCKSCLKQGKS